MLVWNIRQTNDIETNPLECYWAVSSVRKYPRLYRIVEQYPTDTNGMVLGEKPELYVLFEEIDGRPIGDVFSNEKELEKWKNAKKWGDYWFLGNGHFVHAYKTLDEAKARAETQLKYINNLMESFFP